MSLARASNLMTAVRSTRTRFIACGAMLAACIVATSFIASPQRASAQATPTEFRVIPLSAGIHLIRAEVAMEPSERERGLMFRKEMGESQGMVFLFDQPAVQCMWMRNTLIPLSVAFIGNDGRIINVEDMAPQTETNHCAAKPARYALEMNLGWFKRHGVAVGTEIGGLPKAR